MSIIHDSITPPALPNQPPAPPSDPVHAPPPTTRSDMRHAALWGWLYPQRCARRTWNGSLLRAWFSHLVASLLTLFVLSMAVSWYEGGHPFEILIEIGEEFQRNPRVFLLVLSIIIGSFEAGVLALACIIMPWGCQDEPLGKSFANAFRQTWLHTTHVLPAVLLILLPAALYDTWHRDYRDTHGTAWQYAERVLEMQETDYPRQPTLPPGANAEDIQAYSKEFQAYQKKIMELHQARGQQIQQLRAAAMREYYARQPFLFRHGDEVILLIAVAVTFWFLWSLIRAIATPRPEPPMHRDPMCEFCGYNLIATPINSRCPECGQPVIDSLGDHLRPGPPWEHRATIGTWRALAQTVKLAVFRPKALGRMLPARRHFTGHGLFLTAALVAAFVLGAAQCITLFKMEQQRRIERGFYYYDNDMVFEVLAGMWATVLITAGVIGLWAWLVTLVARWQTGRNLGRIALAHAVYASVLPIGWGLIVGALMVAIFGLRLESRILDLLDNPYIDNELIAVALMGIPCLIVIVCYAGAVVRGTLAARWANK